MLDNIRRPPLHCFKRNNECKSIVHSTVLYKSKWPWLLPFSYESPASLPIISGPIHVTQLCDCLVPVEINNHIPFKGRSLSACKPDIASCAYTVLFCHTHPGLYVFPSAAPSLFLCFLYSVSSVLDTPFFLPFFLESWAI